MRVNLRHRQRSSAVLGAVALLGAGSGACRDDAKKPGCLPAAQREIAGTAATLLRAARLDGVGDSFGLIGVDGDKVRWARIDAAGAIGAEGSVTVPSHTMGPWYAFAGNSAAPAGQVLVAYGKPKTGGISEIFIFSVGVDGSGATAPQSVAEIPDADGKILAALGSGKAGDHAVLAWGVPAKTEVKFALVDGSGTFLGGPLGLGGDATKRFDCLAVIAGKAGSAGIGYYEYAGASPDKPEYRLVDVQGDGTVALNITLPLGIKTPDCPAGGPSVVGYVLAFQNVDASWLGVYDDPKQEIQVSNMVGAVRWGGPSSQPPIGAAAGMGQHTAVVFERPSGPEVWRFDYFAKRIAEPLVLPVRQQGTVGRVGAAPGLGVLWVSYADYPEGSAPDGGTDAGKPDGGAEAGGSDGGGGMEAGVPPTGKRQLVKIECP